MNYGRIAEMVHDLVRNPKSMSQEPGLTSAELRTNEFTIIQRVFSECDLSEDVLSLGALPLSFWG